MRLKIRHRTEYRYETPVRYSIQELRLTPPAVAGNPAKYICSFDELKQRSLKTNPAMDVLIGAEDTENFVMSALDDSYKPFL